MRFAKVRWLNSLSRQLLAVTVGGVLFGGVLLLGERAYVGAPLLTRSVAAFGVGSLLLYLVVMRFLLRIVLRPLNEASAIAAKLSPRNLGARLRMEGVPSELRPLVENFNAALGRLEHNDRQQQEFLASAAHELKTPLALIRAQIEMGITDASRQELMKDVTRMGRQIQQLLHLAEAREIQNYKFSSVDVRGLILEVATYLDPLGYSQGVSLRVVADPGTMPLRADRGALFTLMKNLVENAIQHSPPGGVVQIRVDAHSIAVQNAGPGVPPEDLPRIFTRFWRGADRRDVGAGLGLAICQEIAMAHGWELQANPAHAGMSFEVRLDSALSAASC